MGNSSTTLSFLPPRILQEISVIPPLLSPALILGIVKFLEILLHAISHPTGILLALICVCPWMPRRLLPDQGLRLHICAWMTTSANSSYCLIWWSSSKSACTQRRQKEGAPVPLWCAPTHLISHYSFRKIGAWWPSKREYVSISTKVYPPRSALRVYTITNRTPRRTSFDSRSFPSHSWSVFPGLLAFSITNFTLVFTAESVFIRCVLYTYYKPHI